MVPLLDILPNLITILMSSKWLGFFDKIIALDKSMFNVDEDDVE